ncbi:helix-turn-helix transcriptional regulator [Pseudoalteromonas sp. S16_S37]|uniref:helix-turn-helix transcriptional regulator n=1 Tax=Pseudoalteromonas sp. S16_S37 TaxID=2720228 RepID=UPI001680FACA|nr:AlpA family phage regulatory protein [Pseudoalteromonas sp. S16_S37]MBD1582777.1 AlpA family phage regulatory protein [Pseudoalteromonas sp. S16_S37]
MDTSTRLNINGQAIGDEERLLSAKEVSIEVGFSRPLVYKKMANCNFPPCHRISEGRVAWLESDIKIYRSMSQESFDHIYRSRLIEQQEQAA